MDVHIGINQIMALGWLISLIVKTGGY